MTEDIVSLGEHMKGKGKRKGKKRNGGKYREKEEEMDNGSKYSYYERM